MQKRFASVILPVVLAAFTCAPTFAQTRAGVDVGPIGIHMSHDAPPRARHEVRTERPSRNHQWIGGYWERQNDQWAWSGGRWEQPESRNHRWVKPRYHHEHDGYRYEPGRWERR